VTTQNITATVEIRDNVFGTTPVFWWGWPDEAQLADYAEQAEMADRMEQAEPPTENDFEYAALYFGT
jgi:hypothetical protein